MGAIKYLSFLFLLLPKLITAQSSEEFSGELRSWANIKKRFGAMGNGKGDDTRFLQTAIDQLAVSPKKFNDGSNAFTTLYLPAGKYRITSTLVLKGKIGINIIGEDPENTSIIWDGKDDQPMLWANGSSYFRISRITWNANNKNGITGIAIQWKTKWEDEKSQSFAPLNIEISDCFFNGKPLVGITGGTYVGSDATGANDSEVTIQRCRFNDCLEAGVNITGFNALDYWIWDSRFIKCKIGIKNSHGNYHAYRCYFEGSSESDFINDNGYYTSVRGCYSTNSMYFSNDRGSSCNPFKRIFQSNVIKPAQGNSIYFAHTGKPVLLDNTFYKGKASEGTYTLHYSSWCDAIFQVLSAGNRYFMDDPLKIAVNRKHIFSIGDKNSFKGTDTFTNDKFLKSQVVTPVLTRRKLFEVPPNASSKTIQSIITEASQLRGQKSIVHFPFGQYTLDEQIIIPSHSNIQLIGDGMIYASVLKKSKSFPKNKSLLKVAGPTGITIKDLQIGENGTAPDGLLIEFIGIDQPGSLAILDQLSTSAETSVVIDKLDYLRVQKQNSFFSSGNKISGGKLVEQGKGTAGLYCFGGQFANLEVTGNGRVVAKDCWWEGKSRIPLNLSGSGKITLDGIMIAPVGADSNTTVNIGKFTGEISILNAYIQGAVNIAAENPTLSVLLWNIHFYHKLNPTQFLSKNSTFKGAFIGLSTQCFDQNNKACVDIRSAEDRYNRVTAVDDFILQMIKQDRAIIPLVAKKDNLSVTSIFLTRVSLGSCDTGLIFKN